MGLRRLQRRVTDLLQVLDADDAWGGQLSLSDDVVPTATLWDLRYSTIPAIRARYYFECTLPNVVGEYGSQAWRAKHPGFWVLDIAVVAAATSSGNVALSVSGAPRAAGGSLSIGWVVGTKPGGYTSNLVNAGLIDAAVGGSNALVREGFRVLPAHSLPTPIWVPGGAWFEVAGVAVATSYVFTGVFEFPSDVVDASFP